MHNKAMSAAAAQEGSYAGRGDLADGPVGEADNILLKFIDQHLPPAGMLSDSLPIFERNTTAAVNEEESDDARVL